MFGKLDVIFFFDWLVTIFISRSKYGRMISTYTYHSVINHNYLPKIVAVWLNQDPVLVISAFDERVCELGLENSVALH